MKLNLGSGAGTLAGYVNADLAYGDGPYDSVLDAPALAAVGAAARVYCDIYPVGDYFEGQCDVVRCSHALEHFPHAQVVDVLRDWARCLAPGGVLKIAVPDLPKVIAAYEAGHPHALGYLMGGQVDERDFHKCAFDEETLRACLEAVGLEEIGPWSDGARDCSSLPISLNLQGRKPGGQDLTYEQVDQYARELAEKYEAEPEPVSLDVDLTSVQAVMTAPRFGPIDADQAILKAFNGLDLPLLRSGGVFWDQGITRVLEQAIAAGKQWLITVDYDSLFTAADVARLLAVIQNTPGIDALAAYQQRRELDSPLFHLGRGLGEVELDLAEVISQETIAAETAHFGLTVFRASAFAGLERPW